jgi:hypothetical protein
MFKAIFKIGKKCIDTTSQEIFTPFINCYHLHSVTISINGVTYEEDNDFHFIGYKTKWTGAFSLEVADTLIFEINYFYIRPDDEKILNFLIDNSYSDNTKSNQIISKHYTEGQFSLDNGLYKNAALNFGTTLEALLNKALTNQDLNDLINNYNGNADKSAMHFIRQLRNKVHPNRISLTQDITRQEAIIARNHLEEILKLY